MNKARVLLVDDRRVDRLLYKELLGAEDYHFMELDSGELLISTLKEYDVDIVLLDWQMPRINGMDSLILMKENDLIDLIPVVIVTGLEEEEVLKQSFEMGCVDFIQKPINKLEIVSRVQSALRLSRANKELRAQKDQLSELNNVILGQRDQLEATLEINDRMAAQEEERLQQVLEQQKKKILSLEIESSRRFKNVHDITDELNQIKSVVETGMSRKSLYDGIERLEKKINDLSSSADNWEQFKKVFESMHPEFFTAIAKSAKKLTSLDLKHCAYIRMNLETNELASILGVEGKSIQMTRYRLKKKLNLGLKDSLRDFIMSV